MARKKTEASNSTEKPNRVATKGGNAAYGKTGRKNGGWQEVEALRERAALKASLADVWDEDFDLDDEILAELDHKAEFFTPQKEDEEEIFDEDDDSEDFFEEDEI